jgi:hypothetical protein
MTWYRAILLTGSLILILGVPAPALGQTALGPTPDVNPRLSNQAERISEGIRDGSLTAGEAARLEREQSAIAREEQRFLRDGNLSPRERRRLMREEERASRHIWRERHDRQGNMAPTPSVDGRLRNEQRRIDAGIADGSLTEREAHRLHRAEDRIATEEQRFKSDGNFTPREREKVIRDENRLSRQIYRQRHDAQRQR